MKKQIALAIAVAFMFIAAPAFATNWCYQEKATNTTECGNAAGSYATSASGLDGYLYTNYTKPAAISTSLWQVKYAGYYSYEVVTSNYTIPEGCWNQSSILQFRMRSRSDNPFGTRGECWDSLSWQSVYSNETGSISLSTGDTGSNAASLYDGSWSTGVGCIAVIDSDGNCNWYGASGGPPNGYFSPIVGIYEEAMYWALSEISIGTTNIITPSQIIREVEQPVWFNTTFTSNDNIASAWVHADWSGTYANYSMSQDGGTYYYTDTATAGTFHANICGRTEGGMEACSELLEYTVLPPVPLSFECVDDNTLLETDTILFCENGDCNNFVITQNVTCDNGCINNQCNMPRWEMLVIIAGILIPFLLAAWYFGGRH